MTRRAKATAAIFAALISGGAGFAWWDSSLPNGLFAAARTPTFNRDVAPILYEQCVLCHRPGGMGPFNLVTYADARKHARQIAEVTASRFMPPWLPDESCGPFVGTRRLDALQVSTFQRWAEAGAPEGSAAHLPDAPQWPEGWQLGKPDLVVTMPFGYTLPAEGRDVYRNFVVPVGNDARRFVRAVELRPNNPRVVHHAFVLIDTSGDSRRLDARDEDPGFSGMNAGNGASPPAGHFLSWQPGKIPSQDASGTQWALEAGSDVVFQLHMRPSGKPEEIQASVALYFTDQPPTRFPFRLMLRSTDIDIPPGEANYTIESSYELPVDLHVLAVLPHAHYLGRDLQGWAELPDGSRRSIISIQNWDFNWQGDYRFERPLALPKGAVLRMRYAYDNSAGNALNGGRAPERVQYGEQTSDEMGELWLQVLASSPADRALLESDYVRKWAVPDSIATAQATLARDPDNVPTRTNLAAVLVMAGRVDDAETELRRALEIDPDFARAHSHLAHIHMRRKQNGLAIQEFATALRLDPHDFKARNNLGYLLLIGGDADAAAGHFREVLREHPDDPLARANLEKAEREALLKGR